MVTINDTRNKQNKGMRSLPSKMDKSTNAQSFVDYAHHEVHDGKHFFLYATANIENDAGTTWWYIKTADSDDLAHMIITGSANGYCLFELGTGAPEGGDTIDTEFSNNRFPSANVAGTKYKKGGSAIVGFTPVAAATLGRDGTPPAAGRGTFGGDTGAREEFILEKDTIYVVRFTAKMADVDVNLAINFYEHTDKA